MTTTARWIAGLALAGATACGPDRALSDATLGGGSSGTDEGGSTGTNPGTDEGSEDGLTSEPELPAHCQPATEVSPEVVVDAPSVIGSTPGSHGELTSTCTVVTSTPSRVELLCPDQDDPEVTHSVSIGVGGVAELDFRRISSPVSIRLGHVVELFTGEFENTQLVLRDESDTLLFAFANVRSVVFLEEDWLLPVELELDTAVCPLVDDGCFWLRNGVLRVTTPMESEELPESGRVSFRDGSAMIVGRARTYEYRVEGGCADAGPPDDEIRFAFVAAPLGAMR